jgi:predicted TIM-barrel fold metal-dependent hydrolase
MEIIDFHTHPRYDTTSKWGVAMTDEYFVGELMRAGITQAAGSAIRPTMPDKNADPVELMRSLNRDAWEMADKYPAFLIPGIHILPYSPEESAEEIEAHKRRGGVLIGELVPYLMGHESYLEGAYDELLELAAKYSMVLSIHTGTAEESVELARRHPTLPIVMAHPVYNDEYERRLAAVKSRDNLWLDIAGTGIAATGMLRHAVDTVGCEKIVFGTDFPGYNPAMYVQSVLYEHLTDNEREYIFSKNAKDLLRL